MGIKQIDIATFLLYLKSLGLVHIRTKGSHHIYDYPNDSEGKLKRPIVVRPNLKEIPVHHIHTNLIAAGRTKEEFELWMKSPKKKKQ